MKRTGLELMLAGLEQMRQELLGPLAPQLAKIDEEEKRLRAMFGNTSSVKVVPVRRGGRRKNARRIPPVGAKPANLQESVFLTLRDLNRKAHIDEIMKTLINKKYAKERDNLYNSVYSALTKNKQWFEKTGPGEFKLAPGTLNGRVSDGSQEDGEQG